MGEENLPRPFFLSFDFSNLRVERLFNSCKSLCKRLADVSLPKLHRNATWTSLLNIIPLLFWLRYARGFRGSTR